MSAHLGRFTHLIKQPPGSSGHLSFCPVVGCVCPCDLDPLYVTAYQFFGISNPSYGVRIRPSDLPMTLTLQYCGTWDPIYELISCYWQNSTGLLEETHDGGATWDIAGALVQLFMDGPGTYGPNYLKCSYHIYVELGSVSTKSDITTPCGTYTHPSWTGSATIEGCFGS